MALHFNLLFSTRTRAKSRSALSIGICFRPTKRRDSAGFYVLKGAQDLLLSRAFCALSGCPAY